MDLPQEMPGCVETNLSGLSSKQNLLSNWVNNVSLIGHLSKQKYSGNLFQSVIIVTYHYSPQTSWLAATISICGRIFPTLISAKAQWQWGLWLQRSEGQSLRVSKEIKDTPSLLRIKGLDLILALLLYIDDHQNPLPWIVSFWELGHSAGPRRQSYR